MIKPQVLILVPSQVSGQSVPGPILHITSANSTDLLLSGLNVLEYVRYFSFLITKIVLHSSICVRVQIYSVCGRCISQLKILWP